MPDGLGHPARYERGKLFGHRWPTRHNVIKRRHRFKGLGGKPKVRTDAKAWSPNDFDLDVSVREGERAIHGHRAESTLCTYLSNLAHSLRARRDGV